MKRYEFDITLLFDELVERRASIDNPIPGFRSAANEITDRQDAALSEANRNDARDESFSSDDFRFDQPDRGRDCGLCGCPGFRSDQSGLGATGELCSLHDRLNWGRKPIRRTGMGRFPGGSGRTSGKVRIGLILISR